ncbi:divergent polysaccharide deacetylase family protein [Roseomonas sp. HJA6]|uniref:Divergent polysaccharide deacetylase family protein n=1 Tax=Roseomonas alba TaxID=2846776 RepID=A0ABS7AH51_9PROT|nr:divergent polysaccharide deacetylase family protein [Neoroseomonas alba]MBW6400489.1 divergent polysaccharide deacetylase family protein [Neoroseomonas alba]
MRVPGWRALAAFWVVVIGTTAGGAVWLERLGPPEAPAAGAAAPTAETAPTPPATPAGDSETPAAPPQAAEASPAASSPAASDSAAQPPAVPAIAATPPRAPEPPPLAAAMAPRAASRPIPAPDPALLENSRHGMLPRAGADGRTSIRAYGRDFDRRDTRPRVGIIIADIGLNATQTEEAIRRLPPAVALALSPYAARPGQAAERARERGMETLISLPLEPAGYPLNNPGDQALLTGRSMAENMDRLDWVLSRSQGYVGVIGALGAMRGERFATLTEAMGTVQDTLRLRGLLYIDPRPGAASPARAWGRSVDVILDEPAGTRGEIDRRLAELETLARDRGAALGLAGSVTPVLVERITAWSQGLESRGLMLAPVSAMIRRPEGLTSETSATPIRPASAP